MPKEIERKYLIKQPIPWDLGEKQMIRQGYIHISKSKIIRIRILNNEAYLCIKYFNAEDRDEYEYEVPLLDGLEMLSKCKYIVEKIRNVVEPLNHSFVIDVDTYPNGLVVAEVEFKTIEESKNFQPFEWLGDEISGNKEYSNITLAKQKLRFI